MDNGATEPAVVVLPSDTINLNQTSLALQPSSSPLQSFNDITFSETPVTFKTVWPPSMDSPIPRLGSSGYTTDTGYQPELDQETDGPYSRSQQLQRELDVYYGDVEGPPLSVEVVLHNLIKTHIIAKLIAARGACEQSVETGGDGIQRGNQRGNDWIGDSG